MVKKEEAKDKVKERMLKKEMIQKTKNSHTFVYVWIEGKELSYLRLRRIKRKWKINNQKKWKHERLMVFLSNNIEPNGVVVEWSFSYSDFLVISFFEIFSFTSSRFLVGVGIGIRAEVFRLRSFRSRSQSLELKLV